MAKRNGTIIGVAFLMLSACAQTHPVSSEGMPAAGDSAALAPPALPLAPLPASEPIVPAKPKARMKRVAASAEDVSIIASTEWQDHGAVSDMMPMPKLEPVTETELRQVAPLEAEVGIVSFLRRHLLVLLSGLCLGAVGIYAFYIYPNRRQSDSNRFG